MTTPTEQEEGVALVAYDKTLDRVVEILDSVKNTLNVHVSTCGGCGQERRTDWEQYQAAEALQGAITRVQKAANLINVSILPKPPEPPEPPGNE
jgi:hypothetical protein